MQEFLRRGLGRNFLQEVPPQFFSSLLRLVFGEDLDMGIAGEGEAGGDFDGLADPCGDGAGDVGQVAADAHQSGLIHGSS